MSTKFETFLVATGLVVAGGVIMDQGQGTKRDGAVADKISLITGTYQPVETFGKGKNTPSVLVYRNPADNNLAFVGSGYNKGTTPSFAAQALGEHVWLKDGADAMRYLQEGYKGKAPAMVNETLLFHIGIAVAFEQKADGKTGPKTNQAIILVHDIAKDMGLPKDSFTMQNAAQEWNKKSTPDTAIDMKNLPAAPTDLEVTAAMRQRTR